MEKKTASAITLTLLLTSMLTLTFNIQPVKAAGGRVYIRADGSIDPPTAPISTADNTTYTFTDNIYDFIVVERDNIVVEGAGYTVQGTGADESKGIDLSGRTNVTVRNTQITNFYSSIWLDSSSNNIISGNNITANNWCGIWLSGSSNYNSITGNNITNNGYGIWLERSYNNSVSGNNITNNGYGIRLEDSSNYNSISGNTITANNWAGIGLSHSSNNIICHNNFDNARQVYIDTFVANVWDDGYPSGGNYWSDYNGTDLFSGPCQNESGSDGIGDTPYFIDENNRDNYPLVHPYGSIRNLDTNLTYLTIQSAINAPETLNGHTIFVEAGTYYENVVVNKTVSLIGENRETTIIDGKRTENVVSIVQSDVVASGFTIQNGTNGIYVSEFYSRITIHENLIKNTNNAISLRQSSGNNITNNIISLNLYGIKLWYCGGSIIFGNKISLNEYGIELAYSRFFTLRNNSMMNNTYNFGVWSYGKPPYGTLYDFIHDIDTSNVIDGKPVYYLVNQQNGEISRDAGYVGVINSTNVVLKDLLVTSNGQGVLFAFTNNSVVQNVTASNSMNGIRLVCSDNNTINDNIMSKNWHGIYLYNSQNNFVFHNNFMNNKIQASIEESYKNTWDSSYPSGGNYWSNYAGVDADGDGIGDTPYVIDADNQDRYPLMHPWSFPTIRVAVLDSWGADVYDGTIFPWLNNEWSRYGLASIEIDYTSLNKEGISYGDIVLTKADVLIISHAYSGWDFTDSEINAIRRYVEEGHGLIGTYGTLIPENNRKLAELFGMNVSTNYGYPILSSGIFNIPDVAHPLFASLPNPFIAPTVSETMYVPSHDWTFEGVTDGTILALTTDNEAAIIARSATYRSVYFTNQMEEKEVGMPETSIQAFYNAIVWVASPPQAYSLTITAMVGGTTNPAPGTHSHVANSTVQVTAIPAANYLFDYWELDSVNVGSANPYSVTMDKDHTLKAVFELTHRPPPSASINPLSASINVGQSITFTSTVSGGYTPYSYQWYLNGNPVSGATAASWTFTPTTSGIYYVHLKVTDAKDNTAQSDAARIAVATVPVGGYSIPIQIQTKTEPVLPYIALIAILTAIFTKLRRKTKRKR